MDKYVQIYKDSEMPIMMVSMDFIILELNNSALAILGYEKHELINKNISIINYPREDPNPEVLKEILLNDIGQKVQFEQRIVQKNGNVVWVKLLISVIQDDVDKEPFFMGIIEDITDSIIIYNQREYDTLRRNERILRKAIETTAAQITLLDLDGKIIYTNNTFPGIDKEEIVGTNYFNICPKDLIEVIKKNILFVTSSKESVQYGNSFVDEIGQLRHMHYDMSAAYSGNEVIGVSIVSTNIAVVKNLHNKMSETEKMLADALTRTTANMTILELNGIVVYVNNVVRGVNKEEFIGSLIYDYLPEDLSKRIREYIAIVIETKQAIQYKSEYIDPQNQSRFHINDMSPIFLYEEVYRISIVSNELRDERKERGVSIESTKVKAVKDLKQEFKENEQMLEEALKKSNAKMTILDLDGVVIYVNNVVAGLNKEEFVGSHVYDYLSPERAQKIKENIEIVIKTKRPVRFAAEFVDPTNIKHFYLSEMSPVMLNDEVYRISIISNEIKQEEI